MRVVPLGVAVNSPNDDLCDDGLWCNGAETCDAVLACQAGEDPCEDNDCDEEADACVDSCGDGNVHQDEECDDGNQISGDGCSEECTVEEGWLCDDAEPSQCTEEKGLASGGCGCATPGKRDFTGSALIALTFTVFLSGRRQKKLPVL